MSEAPQSAIRQTVSDAKLQLAIFSATGRLVENRRAAKALLPEFEDLRERARAIKQHTLEYLDHYLEQLEAKLTALGGAVHWARDGAEAAEIVTRLARECGADLAVKSKSMTSEEIHLNERLADAGIEAVETDLGEYILQLGNEKPYHIIAPALHKTREDVADLFSAKLGVPRDTEIPRQTALARKVLREMFLRAGIGITGANFLLADSGAVVIVENEGNGRLSSSAPPVHVAIAGIEKVIPRAADLAVFLKLLARSATGQALSVYSSVLAGPKRAAEVDGPRAFHLILLDNGRTRVLADRGKRESLACIRCGACLNHCPVYRKIGGHNYPWVYSGPIGAILTPQFMGRAREPWLPDASSLCGACGAVCPVKIDIPRILLELRAETAAERPDPAQRTAFRLWAWLMRHPRSYEKAAAVARGLTEAGGWTEPASRWLGPLRAWTEERDFPALAPRSFRELWREREGSR